MRSRSSSIVPALAALLLSMAGCGGGSATSGPTEFFPLHARATLAPDYAGSLTLAADLFEAEEGDGEVAIDSQLIEGNHVLRVGLTDLRRGDPPVPFELSLEGGRLTAMAGDAQLTELTADRARASFTSVGAEVVFSFRIDH